MHLDFSDAEHELKRELRRFLDKTCPRSRVRAVLDGNAEQSRSLTSELAASGWLSAALPEASGRKLVEETAFRDKIASYYVAIAGTSHIRARIRTALGKGQTPGPEATIGKTTMSRWLQHMAAYAMDLAGPAGEAIDADSDADLAEIQEAYFLAIGYRIGGGTEEIAKNIIAERLLGLPQEPRPDKQVPFSESSKPPLR